MFSLPKKIFVGLSSFFFAICSILIISESVSFSFHGFGIDSADRLYIGTGHKISVYEGKTEINTITTGTSRGFYFTIQRDDTILLSTSTHVYILDLQGSLIKEITQDIERTHGRIKDGRFRFQTASGDLYIASRPFGRLTIHQGDDVVFKMPLLDYVTMLLTFISAPCFLLSIWLTKRYNKRQGMLP